MFTLGQNFRFGYFDKPSQERIKAIKRAGFDSTMFWWGDEFEDTDLNRYDLFDCAVKEGLSVDTCHFPSTNAHLLWEEGEASETYLKQFDEACKDMHERKVECLVVHLTRKLITAPTNGNGTRNFAKMLESANKYDVIIAIENTRFLNYNDYILSRFSDKHIGFCFDSGHANCYTPSYKPLEKYGKMLTTTHLHDNVGPVGKAPDQHHLIGEGTVDFDYVFDGLKRFDAKHLNLESYCNDDSKYFGKLTMQEYLDLSYQKLSDLAKKHGFER